MKTQTLKLRKKTLFVFKSATHAKNSGKTDPTSDLTKTSLTSSVPSIIISR